MKTEGKVFCEVKTQFELHPKTLHAVLRFLRGGGVLGCSVWLNGIVLEIDDNIFQKKLTYFIFPFHKTTNTFSLNELTVSFKRFACFFC